MSSYILRRNFCSLSPICQTWQNFKDTKGGIQFELKYINLGVYRQQVFKFLIQSVETQSQYNCLLNCPVPFDINLYILQGFLLQLQKNLSYVLCPICVTHMVTKCISNSGGHLTTESCCEAIQLAKPRDRVSVVRCKSISRIILQAQLTGFARSPLTKIGAERQNVPLDT